MPCSRCGAENPGTAKYCIQCASPFVRPCSSCGAENPPRAKFCSQCSSAIDARGAGVQTSSRSDASILDAVFRNEGEFWTIVYRGTTTHMRDAKGLGYLAYLLARPG